MSAPRERPSDELSVKDSKLKAVDVHIAEFNALRAEILARLQSQSQAFGYLVTILAAAVGGITYLLREGEYDLIPQLLLFLPLVVAPLGFIFFDNEMMIFRNGFLIHTDLKAEIRRSIGQNVFLLEQKGTRIGRFNLEVQRVLSFGRWLLFIVPVLGPPVYAAGSIVRWPTLYLAIFIIDCLVSLVLLLAVGGGIVVQARWRKLAERGERAPASEVVG